MTFIVVRMSGESLLHVETTSDTIIAVVQRLLHVPIGMKARLLIKFILPGMTIRLHRMVVYNRAIRRLRMDSARQIQVKGIFHHRQAEQTGSVIENTELTEPSITPRLG